MLSAALGSTAWADSKVGFPNPKPFGYVKLDLPAGIERVVPNGGRTFSFVDNINGIGTSYAVFMVAVGAGATGTMPPPVQPVVFPAQPVAQLTNNGNAVYTFPVQGLFTDTTYAWRVDVNGTPGDVWYFAVPMQAPVNDIRELPGTTDASVYTKFQWEPNPTWSLLAKTEVMYLLPGYDPNQSFVDALGNPRADLVVKTVNLVPPADYVNDIVNDTWNPNIRQYWIHDSGYYRGNTSVGAPIPHLRPSTGYKWRILYTGITGIPGAGVWGDILVLHDGSRGPL